jgi:hypothetical protein
VVQKTEAAIKKDGEKKNVSEDLRFAIIEGELKKKSGTVYVIPYFAEFRQETRKLI